MLATYAPLCIFHLGRIAVMPFFPAIAFIATLTEGLFGYPKRLYSVIRHPVMWQGTLISTLERHLNRPAFSRRKRIATGALSAGVLTAVPVGLAVAISRSLRRAPLPCGILASCCLAQRSLHDHVKAVALALEEGGLQEGRQAVGRIVGRDTSVLDEAAICRATIETLAENFSDGVVAPALWSTLGGLPGAVFYKAVNTADSMIGHRNERYEAFGKTSARLDDLINLPASRLSAFWIVLAAFISGLDWKTALRIICRDARHHSSPNAGWPEAAMAGALGLSIGGPRFYNGTPAPVRWIGDGRQEATPADIRKALDLYHRACIVQIAVFLMISSVKYLFEKASPETQHLQ